MMDRLRFSTLALALVLLPAAVANAGVLTVEYDVTVGQYGLGEVQLDIIGGTIVARFTDPSTPPATAVWTSGEILTLSLTVFNTALSTSRPVVVTSPFQLTNIGGTYTPNSLTGSISGSGPLSTRALTSGGILSFAYFQDFLSPTLSTLDQASFGGYTPNDIYTFSISNLSADEIARDYVPEPSGGVLIAAGFAALLGLVALRRRRR